MRRTVKTAAVAAVSATALLPALTGCGNDLPAAVQPPIATPTTSPTPYKRPTEVALDKAVTAYRGAFHVMNQGKIPAKSVMQKYMTGEYLDSQAEGIGQGLSFEGTGYLDGVTSDGFTGPISAPTGVNLLGCEDFTQLKVFRYGKAVKFSGADTRLYLQKLTATKGSDGVWRVSTFSSTPMSRSTFSTAECNGGVGGKRTT